MHIYIYIYISHHIAFSVTRDTFKRGILSHLKWYYKFIYLFIYLLLTLLRDAKTAVTWLKFILLAVLSFVLFPARQDKPLKQTLIRRLMRVVSGGQTSRSHAAVQGLASTVPTDALPSWSTRLHVHAAIWLSKHFTDHEIRCDKPTQCCFLHLNRW